MEMLPDSLWTTYHGCAAIMPKGQDCADVSPSDVNYLQLVRHGNHSSFSGVTTDCTSPACEDRPWIAQPMEQMTESHVSGEVAKTTMEPLFDPILDEHSRMTMRRDTDDSMDLSFTPGPSLMTSSPHLTSTCLPDLPLLASIIAVRQAIQANPFTSSTVLPSTATGTELKSSSFSAQELLALRGLHEDIARLSRQHGSVDLLAESDSIVGGSSFFREMETVSSLSVLSAEAGGAPRTLGQRISTPHQTRRVASHRLKANRQRRTRKRIAFVKSRSRLSTNHQMSARIPNDKHHPSWPSPTSSDILSGQVSPQMKLPTNFLTHPPSETHPGDAATPLSAVHQHSRHHGSSASMVDSIHPAWSFSSSVHNGPLEAAEEEEENNHFSERLASVDADQSDPVAACARVQQYSDSVKLLLQTWNMVVNKQLRPFADEFFAELLQSGDYFQRAFDSANIAATSYRVITMIGKAVAAFTRPDEMMEIMHEVGARHRMYNITEDQCIVVKDVFMRVYQRHVTEDLFERSQYIWEVFWRNTIDAMHYGLNSVRGVMYRKKYHDAWARRVQQVMEVLLEKERGSPEGDRDHHFFYDVFDLALKRDPSVLHYQRMRTPRASDRAMEALRRIVAHLLDPFVVETYLTELATTHECLGLTPAVTALCKEPFLLTCDRFMLKEVIWSPLARQSMAELWDYVTERWGHARVEDGFHGPTMEQRTECAPNGRMPFCLVFTDVEASTRLWDSNTVIMAAAVQKHHRMIRSIIKDYDGYEVKTVGDSFLIATKDALTALKIALAIQLEFMRVPITEGFKMIDNPQGGGDPVCWRDDSLRIRIGIHYCTDVSAVYDTVHQRYDYYGPDVNCAARVEASACGGQVLMTKAALDALHAIPEFMTEPRPRLLSGLLTSVSFTAHEAVLPLSKMVSFEDVGAQKLKGIAEPVSMYNAVHRALDGRLFPPLSTCRERSLVVNCYESGVATLGCVVSSSL